MSDTDFKIQAVTVPFYKSPHFTCNIELNNLQKAREILETTDEYIQGLSDFDFHSKMQTAEPVTVEQFKAYQASAVIPWTHHDIENWKSLITNLSEKIKEYERVPLPDVIYLNLTSGKEEADAAYTRGKHGIFLPRKMVNWGISDLEGLLLHETWHTISRNLRINNPALRDQIYGCISFKPMGHLFTYPDELTKISNPDAPLFEHYLPVPFPSGEIKNVLPLIYSKKKHYDPRVDHSFFALLVIKLIVVKQEPDGTFVPDRINGELQLIGVNEMPASFWDLIGRNTNYLIHPEETTADNFKLIFSNETIPNPEIPAAIGKLLK